MTQASGSGKHPTKVPLGSPLQGRGTLETTRKFRVKPAESCRNEDEGACLAPEKQDSDMKGFFRDTPYIMVSLSTSAPELKTPKSIEDDRNGRPRRFIPVGRVTVGV